VKLLHRYATRQASRQAGRPVAVNAART
jgi:hypothetical protein